MQGTRMLANSRPRENLSSLSPPISLSHIKGSILSLKLWACSRSQTDESEEGHHGRFFRIVMRAARCYGHSHFSPHCSAYHLPESHEKWLPPAAPPLQVTNTLPAVRGNCREAAEVGVAAKVDGCEATDNHRPCPFHAPSGGACGWKLAPQIRDLARRCRPRGWRWAATWGGATSGGCECRRALPWVG